MVCCNNPASPAVCSSLAVALCPHPGGGLQTPHQSPPALILPPQVRLRDGVTFTYSAVLCRVMLFKYQMAQYISNNKHITHIEKYVKNCRFGDTPSD